MKKHLYVFCLLLSMLSNGQETQYFNKVYNPMGSFARGRGVVELDGDYYCLVNTFDSSNTYQSFIFMKLDGYGEVAHQKLFHVPGHALYPGDVGGTLKKTPNGNLIFAYHAEGNGTAYSSLAEFNKELEILWKQDYTTESFWTMTMNCQDIEGGGYILSGSVKPQEGAFWDFLLLKTDSLGNEQWHQTYGTEWSEHGTNAIQTPDGGYLIGGFFWKPGQDHSMDAMVVKTDSLGNEEWTKYFGNPDVDDDMAFVQMADDGNYLVATVYGEEIFTIESRVGRVLLTKIDSNGEIIWEKKIGKPVLEPYLKNFKYDNDNNLIYSGFYYATDSVSTSNQFAWLLKTDENGDSLWMREYNHFNELDDNNYLYDIAPTSDNGYIAIGQSNEAFTQSNMWAIKLDSMGCDTPGCVTGTSVVEPSPSGGGRGEDLHIWPNPAIKWLNVKSYWLSVEGDIIVTVFDIYGRKVKEVSVPKNKESITFDVGGWESGLYFIRWMVDGESVGGGKVVVE